MVTYWIEKSVGEKNELKYCNLGPIIDDFV